MSVDMQIVEKLLHEFIAVESRPNLDKIFDDYRKDKLYAFDMGMKTFQYFVFDLGKKDPMITTAALMGFVAGAFFLEMTGTKDAELKKKLFDDWFELKAREKGEHVIDFTQHRINKKE